MQTTCPKCNQQLPEVQTLEFRFCPHCGAEIALEPGQIEDVYLTIPPDPPPAPTESPPMDLRPETEKKETASDRFNGRTGEPQKVTDRQQLKLKPPKSPPPAGFFRNRSVKKPPPSLPAEKVPPNREIKKQSPAPNRKIVIATLIILVIIIVVLGALFTF
jgi:Zn-finger nucleic acid-binding protein